MRYRIIENSEHIIIHDTESDLVWWQYPKTLRWNEAYEIERKMRELAGFTDWEIPYLEQLSKIDRTAWPVPFPTEYASYCWSRERDYSGSPDFEDYLAWNFPENCDTSKSAITSINVLFVTSMTNKHS